MHRDIKPGNLLLDDHERLAVADFGIARARLGGPADGHRPGARHGRLPLARAGDGRGRHRRLGPLRARRRGLRAADRRRGRSRPSTSPPRPARTSRTRRRRPPSARRVCHARLTPCWNADWPRTPATAGRALDRVRRRARAHARAARDEQPRAASRTRGAATRRRAAGAKPRRAAGPRPRATEPTAAAPTPARRRTGAPLLAALGGAGAGGGDRGDRAREPRRRRRSPRAESTPEGDRDRHRGDRPRRRPRTPTETATEEPDGDRDRDPDATRRRRRRPRPARRRPAARRSSRPAATRRCGNGDLDAALSNLKAAVDACGNSTEVDPVRLRDVRLRRRARARRPPAGGDPGARGAPDSASTTRTARSGRCSRRPSAPPAE